MIPADLLIWAAVIAVPAFLVALVVMARSSRGDGE